MRDEALELGRRALSGVPRFASGVIVVPVVVGYVALGAGVLVARSLRSVARETWNHLPVLWNHRNGNGAGPA
jgi:hypothetical protein